MITASNIRKVQKCYLIAQTFNYISLQQTSSNFHLHEVLEMSTVQEEYCLIFHILLCLLLSAGWFMIFQYCQFRRIQRELFDHLTLIIFNYSLQYEVVFYMY